MRAADKQLRSSVVHRLTCAQYATAQLSPDQTLLIENSQQRKTVSLLPQSSLRRGQISTTLKAHAYVNHPARRTRLPKNGDLAGALDAAITAIRNAGTTVQKGNTLSRFVPLFRKFQFMVLTDLYHYITSIYTTFNLIHKNTVLGYVVEEPTDAFNKKSLIITHLLNVIQDQMFFICSYHQPLVPKHFGLKAGSLMLQHDNTADPLFFIADFTQPLFAGDLATQGQKIAHENLKKTQTVYLNTLKTILAFFGAYAHYLYEPAPAPALPGANAFSVLAEHIKQLMENNPFNRRTQEIAASNATSKDKIDALREARKSLAPINPPLLHYNDASLRACKVIPALARELPLHAQTVGWPDHLVKSAQAGTQATSRGGERMGFVIAYFEDAQQRRTQNLASAVKLFINLPTVNGPYAQEIKKQPEWLNSTQGIIAMLGACLGDYSTLVGMDVLSPCTERILCAALGQACSGLSSAGCQAEMALIEQTQQQYMQALQGTKQPPPPPPPPSTSTIPQQGFGALGQYTTPSGS